MKKLFVTLIIILSSVVLVACGEDYDKELKDQEAARKKANERAQKIIDEGKKKEKEKQANLDSDKKEFKATMNRKLKQDKDLRKVLLNFDLNVRDGQLTPIIKAYVNKNIASSSESDKQEIANIIGSSLFGAGTATFNADGEHDPQILLYYDGTDTMFAENRIISNPKEMKVNN
ncbi:hypothetical protein JQ662_000216 [Listeria monocytogenes]|nr:hypothetical protein [Listeria monocytogenes]